MRRWVRDAWATGWSTPWRRAPVLLARHLGVAITVAGACAVLTASLAAVPLFLSSVGTASVALQAAERCPRDTGATRATSVRADEVERPAPDPFASLSGALGTSGWWVRLQLVTLTGTDGASTQISLIARDDADDHVDVLEGPAAGPGIWITDRAAAATGLAVGDEATISGTTVPVVAVYRDLSGNVVDDYWCSHADLLLIEVLNGDLRRPPPMTLADRGTFAAVMAGSTQESATSAWEAPLGPDLTVAETEDLLASLACRGGSEVVSWCADGQPLVPRRAGGLSREPVAAQDDEDFVRRYLRSSLPFVVDRAHAIQSSVGGGTWPVAGFAGLAGLALVAASATLWFDRRRREITLFTVRGISPGAIGLKAVLELSIALLAGAAAGLGLSYALVAWLGPSTVIEASAVRRAAIAALLAALVAAATVAGVVTLRLRGDHARPGRRLPWTLVPWELGLAWATVVSHRRLGDWGIPVGRGAEVSKVDVWGLLFPVLFLITAIAVVSRVFALALRPLRRTSRRWPTVPYLAIRRLARHRAAALGLVAAAAMAAGVLGYAATMNRSLAATLDSKAETFVGSDVAVRIPADRALPPTLEAASTEVEIHNRAWMEVDGDRETVAVRAIDPATFGRAASWDPSFAADSLDDVLARLSTPTDDGSIPAVVVGAEVDGPTEVGILRPTTSRITVTATEEVRAFPGMSRPRPTVFVDAARLDEAGVPAGDPELWVRGRPEAIRDELLDAGIAFEEVRAVEEVADGSAFVTVSWTFGFLQSLGISAGVLVVGGVAVHLDARRRSRVLGYTFLRRMGLSARQHRRALQLELVASVAVGCWIGLAVAFAASSIAHAEIDPVPGFRPDPLHRPAAGLMVALAAGALVVAWVAARVAQRRTDRDDPVEVFRGGT